MKIARLILSMLHDEALMGDIEEEYLVRRREFGSRAALGWYCREVAMAIATRRVTMRQPLIFALALGVGGGLLLAASLAVTTGPAILVIYALVPVFSAFYLRAMRVDGFVRRFVVGVGSFMIATIIVYVVLNFMLGLGRISWRGHASLLGLMFVIGSGLAASIAQITTPRVTDDRRNAHHPIAFTIALGGFGSAALWTSLYGRWVGAIFACALILLIAAWYLSKERVPGFWSRYAITASSYILAMAITIAIIYMNRPADVHWPFLATRVAILFLAGCLFSFVVARWTAPEPEPATR
ncbi:MAG: hypothetical protein ACXVIJ_03750 [Thermoanaerobaculia bacterium]